MFVIYFYYIKKIQISYSTYHKPNGGIDVFKMQHKKLSNLLFCVFVKNCHIFKWDFRQTFFFGLIYHVWTLMIYHVYIFISPPKNLIIKNVYLYFITKNILPHGTNVINFIYLFIYLFQPIIKCCMYFLHVHHLFVNVYSMIIDANIILM
jgi:hypothetical protein